MLALTTTYSLNLAERVSIARSADITNGAAFSATSLRAFVLINSAAIGSCSFKDFTEGISNSAGKLTVDVAVIYKHHIGVYTLPLETSRNCSNGLQLVFSVGRRDISLNVTTSPS